MDMPERPILQPDDVLKAYTLGYFPMSEARDDPKVFWVLPQWRGILPLDNLTISTSLRKSLRQNRFDVTSNTAFAQVMEHCAERTSFREDTWINHKIIEVYCELHQQGHAHSIECWQDERLVGGLYGISIGGAFFGESMFSRVSDASKVALVHLVARLNIGGYGLLDTQFITDHLARLGAIEIEKNDYQKLLEEALILDGNFKAIEEVSEAYSDGSFILQSITQTS